MFILSIGNKSPVNNFYDIIYRPTLRFARTREYPKGICRCHYSPKRDMG